MLRVVLALLLIAPAAHAQSSQPREGLNALSDDSLMNELAARGLDTLLNRAFEVNNVPNTERHARRSLISLARLADPKAKLAAAERRQLIDDVVRGIGPALPSLDDPQLLMRQAFVLITEGALRDVNTLEYWGENPRTQAQLRPVIETVIKMLERAEQLARKRAEDLAAKVNSPSSPLVAKYEEIDRLAATAEYTKNMAMYYVALSLDQSSARRRQVADSAFEYLQQYDVDENPDRNLVRTRMAKLKMARAAL
jgi:transposase